MQGKMYVIEYPHAWIDGKAVSVVGYGMSQNVVHHQYKYGARVSLSSTPEDSSNGSASPSVVVTTALAA